MAYTNVNLSITASTYKVSFTRTDAATDTASICVLLSGVADQVVAEYSGPVTWDTDPGDYNANINLENSIKIFFTPVEGSTYYAVVTSDLDGGTASLATTYVQPYTDLTIGNVLATGYPVTVTRTSEAVGTAKLYIRCGSAYIATVDSDQPWTVPGTFSILVTADNSKNYIPPSIGSKYVAQFVSLDDDNWYKSSPLSPAYVVPYSNLSLSAINPTGYTVKYVQNVSATGGPTLEIKAGGVSVAKYNGVSSVGSTTIILDSSNSVGWVQPVKGTTYTVTLTDVPDNVTLTASRKY